MKILKKLFQKSQQQGEFINLDVNFKPRVKKVGNSPKDSFNDWYQKICSNQIYSK